MEKPNANLYPSRGESPAAVEPARSCWRPVCRDLKRGHLLPGERDGTAPPRIRSGDPGDPGGPGRLILRPGCAEKGCRSQPDAERRPPGFPSPPGTPLSGPLPPKTGPSLRLAPPAASPPRARPARPDRNCEAQKNVRNLAPRPRSPARPRSLLAFFREQIELLTDCNRHGTAMNYRRAVAALSAFLDGRDLRFAELTARFVERYDDFLRRRGMVRNSRSFHMRILRAVYNKAVRRGYAEQTFPFRDVYTGIDRTRKRAVDESVIARLIRLDLTPGSSLAFARDLFLFSFYTRGMAFVDLVYLRKSNLRDGVIRYARHKSGQELAVRVEPCIRAIINRYAEAVRGTPYLFPLLADDDPAACFRRYKTELRSYNNRLGRLSRLLGLEERLSSYTARHSWATMARNCQVPLSVISAGMGHTSERTTQIYLKSLENSLIDRANRGLLERLNEALSW